MIKDLVLNEELDRNAMTNVRGGWFAPGMAMAAVVRAVSSPVDPPSLNAWGREGDAAAGNGGQ